MGMFVGIPGTGVQWVPARYFVLACICWPTQHWGMWVCVRFCMLACVCWYAQHWGTVNAAVKAPSAENPELSAVLCLKPEIE